MCTRFSTIRVFNVFISRDNVVGVSLTDSSYTGMKRAAEIKWKHHINHYYPVVMVLLDRISRQPQQVLIFLRECVNLGR